MRTLDELEAIIGGPPPALDARAAATELLTAAEEVIEHWIVAKGETPTSDTREGFRLLALHRQGAKGDPSFNACRETCREVAYHYNLVIMEPDHGETVQRLQMMGLVTNHLFLFISGKLQVAGLGEFCCSSKPLRSAQDTEKKLQKEA